jgi:hypothetical protein
MMLLPYIKEPATGSRIPSISTGGAAMNAMMKQDVAVNKVGIIKQPNQPMYKRFSVLVTHAQKRSHKLALARFSKVAVIIIFMFVFNSQDFPVTIYYKTF